MDSHGYQVRDAPAQAIIDACWTAALLQITPVWSDLGLSYSVQAVSDDS